MKFLVLALAVVAAQDEEEAAGCGDGDACAEGECCGTTAPEEGDGVVMCGAADAATVVDVDTEEDVAFACNEEAAAEEERAFGLATTASVALATMAYTFM